MRVVYQLHNKVLHVDDIFLSWLFGSYINQLLELKAALTSGNSSIMCIHIVPIN